MRYARVVTESPAIRLVPVTRRHLGELMGWFPDARSCAAWAGPEFRYPYDDDTFRHDIRLDLPSLSLVAGDDLLAFGQYYLRAGRCHLARLVVSPHRRRRGMGVRLVRELARAGSDRLGTRECSLFVMEDNAAAIATYRRAGFSFTAYPGEMPLANCAYMTAALTSLVDAA
jgi:ribosomal protein S18 acetylase RimI-like enzyme